MMIDLGGGDKVDVDDDELVMKIKLLLHCSVQIVSAILMIGFSAVFMLRVKKSRRGMMIVTMMMIMGNIKTLEVRISILLDPGF